MTIDEYCDWLDSASRKFREEVKRESERDPDNWPVQLNHAEWDEQFEFMSEDY